MQPVTRMLPHDMQLANEYTYSRKHIDGYLRQAILDNPEMVAKVDQGVQLLTNWMSQDYYESKNRRLTQLQALELRSLVISIFQGVCYCQTPELFVSVTSQLAGRLGFDEKREAIQTVAEIMAVLCQTDAFDIIQPEVGASLLVKSNIPIPEKLLRAIERSEYLPPMVCQPQEVRSNYESAYLTHNDCVVLGKGNGHDGDLCLDVINTQNAVALSLDEDFLAVVPEKPTYELDTLEKQRQWNQFQRISHEIYGLLLQQGNQFHLTHKVDKRGRLYAQGYHVTTQGTSYKKAMVELAHKEIVEGVPNGSTRTGQ